MDGYRIRTEKKKELILKTAFDLILTFGVNKMSIAEVSKKANIFPVSVYNYFGSKIGLSIIIDHFPGNKYCGYLIGVDKGISIMKFLNLTFELVVGFFLLFIIVKVVGRKIITQVTPFTFITASVNLYGFEVLSKENRLR